MHNIIMVKNSLKNEIYSIYKYYVYYVPIHRQNNSTVNPSILDSVTKYIFMYNIHT